MTIRLTRGKRGQGDFIVRVFSMLAYTLVAVFVLLMLAIPQCTKRDEVKDALDSRDKEMLELRADEQLAVYLRTPMPADLPLMIEDIKERADNGEFFEKDESPLWNELPTSGEFDTANTFIKRHPEVYAHKTYGDFIIALEPYQATESREAENVFDIVTRTLFVEKIREHVGRYQLGEVYASPVISVKYESDDALESRGDFITDRGYVYDNDLLTAPLESTIVLPVHDFGSARVTLQVLMHNILVRLPEP